MRSEILMNTLEADVDPCFHNRFVLVLDLNIIASEKKVWVVSNISYKIEHILHEITNKNGFLDFFYKKHRGGGSALCGCRKPRNVMLLAITQPFMPGCFNKRIILS
ncbi:hypothetical protein GJV44_00104 [Candidatus Vallotia cooleyia]|nr:hypothetical protein GJV44_00104 [Candidatus Vallotia cooleyia]